MRVRKWITVEQEVEVDVGPEDVAAALAELAAGADRERAALLVASAAHVALSKVDPQQVSPANRAAIAGWLAS